MSDKLKNFLKLPQKAQEIYFEHKDYCVVELLNNRKANRIEFITTDFIYFEECESPIEKIMLMALVICECKRNFWDRYHYGIIHCPQQEYEFGDKKYRSDITICFEDVCEENKAGDFEIVVECDGHYFHEKTKEQVKRNNQRDYDFKCAGIDIFHFSGSEIFNNPIECAEKIYDYAEGKIKNVR